MSSPPYDKSEFWIRFVCGFVVFGIVFGLFALRFVDTIGSTVTLVAVAVATLSASFYVARVGDSGWRDLFDSLRWW